MRLHASAVAYDGRGVLIQGASGTGKSGLCLQLMALGAVLISDDQTCLERRDAALWASAPDPLNGLIEARGIGLLRADATPAPITLVIDMDRTEPDRLPPLRQIDILDVTLPLLQKTDSAAWPAGILQYLKRGRSAPA